MSTVVTPSIRLLNLSPELCTELLTSPENWLQTQGLTCAAPLESLSDLVQQSRDFMAQVGGESRYFGYLGIDSSNNEIVGACGFHGPPTERGELEISFSTFPHKQGEGFGTAMAKGLIELTPSWGKVRAIIAHTPGESGPATAILEKIGMRQIGEISDPEDGTIWRWMCMN